MKGLIFFILCLLSSLTYCQSFVVGNEKITPGTLTHITINDSNSSEIPVMVLHGKNKGIVLGIICETSENGFSPIFSGFSVFKNLDPKKVSGTIIFINTNDLKSIPENFINAFDYLITISSSREYEELLPLVQFYIGEDELFSSKSRELAINSYMPYALVIEKQFSIPFLNIKFGTVGANDAENINLLNNTLRSLAVYLGFRSEELPVKGTLIIEETQSVMSDLSGYFFSDCKVGTFIKKGELLGYITDEFGNSIEEIIAPTSGVILQRKGISVVSADESLFTIGIVYM